MIAPLIYHRKNPAFLRAGMETFSNIFSQRFQRPDNAFTHRLNGHALGLGNLGSTHAHKEKGIIRFISSTVILIASFLLFLF